MFSETRPLKRASSLVLGGARGIAICYFCSLNAPLGKAVGDREASKGGSSSCNLKSHPPSTIGSGAYTTSPSLWTTSSTGLWERRPGTKFMAVFLQHICTNVNTQNDVWPKKMQLPEITHRASSVAYTWPP